jgi:hypothetical protein
LGVKIKKLKMKIESVPQDLRYYKDTVVRDLVYAVDNQGHYQHVTSDGWEPKNDALEVQMEETLDKCREILERVKRGDASPLEYHASRNLMPIELLAEYTGISKRKIQKHFDPKTFSELDGKTLEKYADALRITVEELKSIPDKVTWNFR